MTYAINGSLTTIGPTTVRWLPNTIGTALNGRSIFSRYFTIEMNFQGGSIPDVRQWLDNVSSTSFNLTTLSRDQLSYVTLSNVNAEISQWPSVEDVNYTEFSIIVKGAL